MVQPKLFKGTCNFISLINLVNGMVVVISKKKLIWIKFLRNSTMKLMGERKMKKRKVQIKLKKKLKNQRKVVEKMLKNQMIKQINLNHDS